MKNYTAKNFVEHLKNIDFPNYKAYSCVNMAYLDFISKLTDVIDSLCPSKKIRIKGNTKPWFDSEVILMVNKRDKDIFRTTNNFLKTTIEKKKKDVFQNKLQENSKSSKEIWKTLKSLRLNSKKAGQSKLCLKEDDVVQFEQQQQQKKANIFKTFYSELTGNLAKKLPKSLLSNLIQKKLRCSTKN